MHELAVTQNLLDMALSKAAEAGARKITRVNVTIGELSGAVPDCIQFYFDVLRKGTAAEEATLNLISIPARLHCRQCQSDFRPEDLPWTCPRCGSLSLEITGGQELFLESLEVAE